MATPKTSTTQGFFGRDELYGNRLDDVYSKGENFLVLSVAQDEPITLPDGTELKTRTRLETRKLNPETLRPEGLPIVCKTAGQVIYNHAAEQAPGDFPAVCYWDLVDVERFNNQAMVLRKLSGWPMSDDLQAMIRGEA